MGLIDSIRQIFRRAEPVGTEAIFSSLSGTVGVSEAMNVPAFAACVNWICDRAASLPVKLYRERDGKTNTYHRFFHFSTSLRHTSPLRSGLSVSGSQVSCASVAIRMQSMSGAPVLLPSRSVFSLIVSLITFSPCARFIVPATG